MVRRHFVAPLARGVSFFFFFAFASPCTRGGRYLVTLTATTTETTTETATGTRFDDDASHLIANETHEASIALLANVDAPVTPERACDHPRSPTDDRAATDRAAPYALSCYHSARLSSTLFLSPSFHPHHPRSPRQSRSSTFHSAGPNLRRGCARRGLVA